MFPDSPTHVVPTKLHTYAAPSMEVSAYANAGKIGGFLHHEGERKAVAGRSQEGTLEHGRTKNSFGSDGLTLERLETYRLFLCFG